MRSILAALTISLIATACGEGTDEVGTCSEDNPEKCDTPKGKLDQVCKNSRASAMDEKRPHFTPQGVRWQCRDVSGVTADSNTQDDRGQEYCEYFTMIHTDGIPEVLGDAFCDATTPCASGSCDESINSCVSAKSIDSSKPADILGKNLDPQSGMVTPLDPVLKKGQIDWLALNPDSKVGTCLFTSWHEDIERPVSTNETIEGWRLDAMTPNVQSEPLFRMMGSVNSNSAAKQLVKDMLAPGKKSFPDAFTRGCMNCGTINRGQSCVPFRQSDPSLAVAAMRIAECGCTVTANGQTKPLDLKKTSDMSALTEMFVPTSRRGFTLGTWDNIGALPTGCRFVRLGDSPDYKIGNLAVNDKNVDQQIVACDLKASQITASTAKDPKEVCRAAYADDIVVHVRFPTTEMATVKCDTTKPKCQGAPWDFSNL